MSNTDWTEKAREIMSQTHTEDFTLMHVPGSRLDHSKRALGTLKRFFPSLQLVRALDHSHVRYVSRVQGLVLWGGGDVHPEAYGQKANPDFPLIGVDRERDKLEIALAREAIKHGVPVLGICRGMQIINVALSGTLWQDWEEARKNPHKETHTITALWPLAEHLPSLTVNSTHHQSIKTLGSGLTTVAHHDGTIEAIHRPGVLGVQWHPESLMLDEPGWIDVFMWWAKGLQ